MRRSRRQALTCMELMTLLSSPVCTPATSCSRFRSTLICVVYVQVLDSFHQRPCPSVGMQNDCPQLCARAYLELLGGQEEGGRHQRRLLLQGLLGPRARSPTPPALVQGVAVARLGFGWWCIVFRMDDELCIKRSLPPALPSSPTDLVCAQEALRQVRRGLPAEDHRELPGRVGGPQVQRLLRAPEHVLVHGLLHHGLRHERRARVGVVVAHAVGLVWGDVDGGW